MRVTWGGSTVVGPGVSTFFFNSTAMAGVPAAVVQLFTALKPYIPSGTSITIPSAGEKLDEATSELAGAWTATGGAAVLGAGGAAPFLLGTGARLRWQTGAIVGGRRVVGSTFIVPMTAQELGSGIVAGGTQSIINAACAAFLAAVPGAFGVYSKHQPARPGAGGTLPARDGVWSQVTSGIVDPDMTWLRSRRT
jgi:hypothetical protein